MNFPEDRNYTSEHEWAKHEDGRIFVGITDYAQDQLGDVVFVSLPETGADVTAGEACGEVESTKSVSDIYSPVSGTVAARNEALEQTPELVNEDPYGEGWLIAVDAPAEALDGLMSAGEYRRLVESAEEPLDQP